MINVILFLVTVVILALLLILPLIHLLIMQYGSNDYLVFLLTLVIGILVIVTIVRWTAIHFGM